MRTGFTAEVPLNRKQLLVVADAGNHGEIFEFDGVAPGHGTRLWYGKGKGVHRAKGAGATPEGSDPSGNKRWWREQDASLWPIATLPA